jgi:hypothetical protein
MAQQRIGAGGEDCGHPAALARKQLARSKGVDARVYPVKTPSAQPDRDCISLEAQVPQLAPSHNPILSTRELCQLAIVIASP